MVVGGSEDMRSTERPKNWMKTKGNFYFFFKEAVVAA